MSARGPSAKGWWAMDATGVVVIVALSVATWAAVARPLAAERAAAAAILAQIGDARLEGQRLEIRRRELTDRLRVMRAELDASPLQLLTATQLNRRLALIVEQATASGLEINGTRAGDVTSGERFNTVPIEVAGDGSFSNCAAFLHRLHANLPDVEVLGVELTGRGSRRDASAQFRFDLSWYAAATVASAAARDE